MQGVVKNWGTSAAARIAASLLEAARMRLDPPVEVREEGGRIVIEPLRLACYDIETVVAGITDENRHSRSIWAKRLAKKAGSGAGVYSEC